MTTMHTPVAFFVFNRPALTRRVFAAIREAQPRKLLVVADGPRVDRAGEAERCAEVRAIVEQVDWPCEVEHDYADVNLGCRSRIASGLDWVFDRVDRAIILEDDCLPDPTFFVYSAELLDRYAADPHVMHVSGTSFMRYGWPGRASYVATRQPFVWGWATWRRAWQHYDVALADWPQFRDRDGLRAWFADPRDRAGWVARFDDVHAGKIDTWDLQWAYTCMRSGGVSLMPTRNLVSNLGFGADATHTRVWSRSAGMPLRPLDAPLTHPTALAIDPALEADLQARLYRPLPTWMALARRWARKLIVGAQHLAAPHPARQSRGISPTSGTRP